MSNGESSAFWSCLQFPEFFGVQPWQVHWWYKASSNVCLSPYRSFTLVYLFYSGILFFYVLLNLGQPTDRTHTIGICSSWLRVWQNPDDCSVYSHFTENQNLQESERNTILMCLYELVTTSECLSVILAPAGEAQQPSMALLMCLRSCMSSCNSYTISPN